MAGARVFFAAALGALSACSLLVNLEDLSGPADVVSDAAGEAEAGSFCANKPPNRIFCADFDLQPYLGNWEVALPDATGGITTSTWTSPPNAYLSESPATDAAEYPPAQHLSRVQLPLPSPRAFTVGFSMYVSAVDPTLLAGFMIVEFDSTSFHWELELSTQSSLLHELTDDGGVNGIFPVEIQRLYGAWHRIELRFDASDGGSGIVTLTADGQSVFQGAAAQPSQGGPLTGSSLTMQLGVFPNYGPESAVSAYYDDVFVDVPP